MAETNYGICWGDNGYAMCGRGGDGPGAAGAGVRGRGIFRGVWGGADQLGAVNVHTGFRDARDGTVNTVMMSEFGRVKDNGDFRGGLGVVPLDGDLPRPALRNWPSRPGT